LLRQRKKAKKGERREAALRVPAELAGKAGNEKNSPAAQTIFISYPLYLLIQRQPPSAIRSARFDLKFVCSVLNLKLKRINLIFDG
jgi:hypothetical protein